ncbi:MAG: peptidoglycan bridge formation glycyltransferase FemA/FemB family protein [Anaerolineae bacterium]|nr:peptidoglycan bridge formation glycyltransferase FemA/FemB family protein [Anaerolineae bacterium]
MTDLSIDIITDRSMWNDALRQLPYAHVLQTWEWGDFKHVTTGWRPIRLMYKRGDQVVAMASVGLRSLGPLNMMYVSKGPALAYQDAELASDVLDHLQRAARHNRAVWLKLDPDVIAATGVPSTAVAIDDSLVNQPDDTPDPTGQAFMRLLRDRHWRFSNDQVQFRNTITIDLTQTEEQLLAGMSQSTRRKVRIAEREGVTVRAGTVDDLPLLYDLYRVTGERDNFLIRPPSYYEQAWRAFIAAGLAHPLIAEVDGKAIAQVILFHFGQKCWYFYGASSDDQRDKMPNYLLQWEAMRWAKRQGYTIYDMWGAPNAFTEDDPLWGVYNFKRGFRGTVTRHIGAWDYAPYPLLYNAFEELYPRFLNWMRGRRQKGST